MITTFEILRGLAGGNAYPSNLEDLTSAWKQLVELHRQDQRAALEAGSAEAAATAGIKACHAGTMVALCEAMQEVSKLTEQAESHIETMEQGADEHLAEPFPYLVHLLQVTASLSIFLRGVGGMRGFMSQDPLGESVVGTEQALRAAASLQKDLTPEGVHVLGLAAVTRGMLRTILVTNPPDPLP